ncbi:Rieske (2Fe-2S) protein [Saccharothrix australiensis]|uniref:Toluene 4-monooxygenase protein C n=1 Tax=Saccharothrix australiensis TaxID=2072 RepID=A0A495W5I4_9PSEU|nr:Rieske 2Fe-2S domain-containing protein [Saccharothrix australiensis]RKT55078.1 toluene 4-monooxygenase protein C [Saccharothrix australiensis]
MSARGQTGGEWVSALRLDELWEGEMVGLELAGHEVLLLNLDGRVCAYRNRCPHQGTPLDEGDLDGDTLTCGGHLWEFDVRSGQGINPAGCALRPYPVRVADDVVWVELPR